MKKNGKNQIYLSLPRTLEEKIEKIQGDYPTRNACFIALLKRGLEVEGK